MLIILCFTAIAVSPSRTSTIAQSHTLTIERPTIEYFTEDASHDLYFHVFNSTGHWLTNSTCNCLLHVYNYSTGKHIYEENLKFAHNYDFEAELNSSMFSEKGLYPYVVQCNTTYEGGFYQGYYEVNDHSRELSTTDTTPSISIILFILFATALMFLMPKIIGPVTKNPIVNLLVSRCFIIIGFYLMVMNCGIIGEIATTAAYSSAEIFRYLWLFGQAGYLLMFGTFIKTFFDLIETWTTIQKEKRGL